jgi:DNA repair protein RadC
MEEIAIETFLAAIVESPGQAEALATAYPGCSIRNATYDDLESVVGGRIAKLILAAVEFGEVLCRREEEFQVSSLSGMLMFLREALPDVARLEQECMWVVAFNSRLKPISVREIARGSVSDVAVHPREVFKHALRANAHSVCVAHNHPSGREYPSPADDELTERLATAGRLMGIPVIDHVILTADTHYSYASERAHVLAG